MPDSPVRIYPGWASNHERECLRRYEEISRRLWRLEMLFISIGGSIIVGMVTLTIMLINKIIWVSQ